MMKYASFLVILFSSSSFAVSPDFNSMEVKISYPCEVESKLNLEKEEKELITFYDGNGNPLYRDGLVLRMRKGKEEGDFTAKYRAQSATLDFNETLYRSMLSRQDGKFKCEIDLVYDSGNNHRAFKSCSFKTDIPTLSSGHREFIRMTGKNPNLEGLKEFKVESIGKKIKLSSAEKAENPFEKKPAVEKWLLRGECKLEVSGKFDIKGLSEAEIKSLSDKGFSFIRKIVPGAPSSVQGNKTGWALGL